MAIMQNGNFHKLDREALARRQGRGAVQVQVDALSVAARESNRQMSMKCQGLVEGSSSRDSESGRIAAASIAAAILSVGTQPHQRRMRI